MPITTAPIGNPVITSYELLKTKSGANRVYSVIDTNKANPGSVQITTQARPFKRVEIVRDNKQIGRISPLRFTLFVDYAEALTSWSEGGGELTL